MIFGGQKVPYVEVARAFARSPSSFAYEIMDMPKGGGRLRRKRVAPIEMVIPIVLSRRNLGGASWDDIKDNLAALLYKDEDKSLSFTHGDGKYYMAQVVAINIEDEEEYAAKGNIVVVAENPMRYGEDYVLTVGASTSYVINGQTNAQWTSETTFKAVANKYTLTAFGGNITINFGFIRGDVLRINSATRSITLNGIRKDVGLSLDSEWFELVPGVMTLSATHETKISYTERFY